MAEGKDKGGLPQPKAHSGRFVQRIPRTLHMRLDRQAVVEDRSSYQLAATFLSEGLCRSPRSQLVAPRLEPAVRSVQSCRGPAAGDVGPMGTTPREP